MGPFVVIKDDKSEEFDPKLAAQSADYEQALAFADQTNSSDIKSLNSDAGKVAGNREHCYVVGKDDIKNRRLI